MINLSYVALGLDPPQISSRLPTRFALLGGQHDAAGRAQHKQCGPIDQVLRSALTIRGAAVMVQVDVTGQR